MKLGQLSHMPNVKIGQALLESD